MMKTTKKFATEWAYNCPYCGNTQGYTDWVDDNSDKICECNNCRKEFKIEEE